MTAFWRNCESSSVNQLRMFFAERRRDVPTTFDPPEVWQWNFGDHEAIGWGGPSVIFDDRALNDAHGLRMAWRNFYSCDDDPGCSNVGGTCDPAGWCADDTWGPFSGLRVTPFALGDDPGQYADYSDWVGLQWGFCAGLRRFASTAPNTTDDYVRNAYSWELDACGNIPPYPEPVPGGVGFITTPLAGDPTAYPELYNPEETVCD